MKYLLALLVLCSSLQAALCQQLSFEEQLQLQDSLTLRYLREKIFIHYDKPYYKPNDSIWLKGYVLDAVEHRYHDNTGIAYIDIINDENEVVKRISAVVLFGSFSSCIALPPDDFKQGSYILKAYTNWMRNFGDSLFFESRFKIIDPRSGQWRADIRKIDFSNNKFTLHAILKSDDAQPLQNTGISLKLRSGLRNFLNLRTATDANGTIYIDTALSNIKPEKNVILELSSKNNIQLNIPVKNSAVSAIDLQFLPEGGNLIAGIEQKIGFKAIDIFGKGIDVSGVIKDSKQKVTTRFSTIHNGMGVFSISPVAGEKYFAELANGTVYDLPEIKTNTTSFQVNSTAGSDSITVKVLSVPQLLPAVYYFAGSVRGVTYAIAKISTAKEETEITLHKKLFPQGIARFTLYDKNLNPLNERISFIWHNEEIKLSVASHKSQYQQKDSVSLIIKSVNENAAPVTGSFSIAVIDTAQVKIPVNYENILSYMLLSSDLKGSIEDPYFYIKNPYGPATEALMLTQGWVSYDWKTLQPAFEKEHEFSISGRVSNAFNKALPNVSVVLFAKVGSSGVILKDTVANDSGIFTFNNFPLFLNDSVSMVLRSLNKRGKAFNVGIDLAPQTYPLYPDDASLAWQDNILFDTVSRKYILGQQMLRQQIKRDGNFLEEVVVSAKVKIPGSKNLNKDGGADKVITEKTLDKTPKASLLDLLRKQVPGFIAFRGRPLTIGHSKVEIIMDGMELAWFEMDPMDILEYYSAEDVKGIEFMSSLKYNMVYRNRFLDPMVSAVKDYTFLEITTKTGQGPFLKKIPGIYLYKPLVPVISRQFYSPKYASSEQETAFPDLRSTIYWNPGIFTNEKGEAEVSFYTSESNSSYLIILQGTDLNGRFGVKQQYLNIEATK